MGQCLAPGDATLPNKTSLNSLSSQSARISLRKEVDIATKQDKKNKPSLTVNTNLTENGDIASSNNKETPNMDGSSVKKKKFQPPDTPEIIQSNTTTSNTNRYSLKKSTAAASTENRDQLLKTASQQNILARTSNLGEEVYRVGKSSDLDDMLDIVVTVPDGSTNGARHSMDKGGFSVGTPTTPNGRPLSLSASVSARLSGLRLSLNGGNSGGGLKQTSSLQRMIESQRKQSRVGKFSDLTNQHILDVVSHVLGQKKDQDRACVVPNLIDGIVYAAIFDGHGRDGETRSELATTRVPELLREKFAKQLDSAEKRGEVRTLKEQEIHVALEETYAEFHKELDALYEEQVLKPSKEVRATKLQEYAELHGIDPANLEINERMPQDGGTTATSVVVSNEFVVIGWVGDSRAVLCRRIAKKKTVLNRFSSRLKVMTLTDDHNVAANDDEELTRVAESGGEIYGKHIAGAQVEGMLQLTRSLGDSPFHRTGLVTSKPGIITVPLLDANADPLLFALVASDGLWDYFSNKEAISFVFRKLKKDGYADAGNALLRQEMLLDSARMLENEAMRRAYDRRGHSDDISVLIITFTQGWVLEEEGAPNF